MYNPWPSFSHQLKGGASSYFLITHLATTSLSFRPPPAKPLWLENKPMWLVTWAHPPFPHVRLCLVMLPYSLNRTVVIGVASCMSMFFHLTLCCGLHEPQECTKSVTLSPERNRPLTAEKNESFDTDPSWQGPMNLRPGPREGTVHGPLSAAFPGVMGQVTEEQDGAWDFSGQTWDWAALLQLEHWLLMIESSSPEIDQI